MKKILCVILTVLMMLSFVSCGAQRGQSYESALVMKQTLKGVWTTEAMFDQIEITFDTLTYTSRDSMTYEDEVYEWEITWDHEKGRICFEGVEDPDLFAVVEENGTAIRFNELRFLPGGELNKKPIPQSLLYDAAMGQIFEYGIWSVDFGTLCQRVTRGTEVDYYHFDDYIGYFGKPGELKRKKQEYGGDAYFVTLTGEVSRNATISNFYHPSETFAKFFIIVDGNRVLYTETCFYTEELRTAAITYFTRY